MGVWNKFRNLPLRRAVPACSSACQEKKLVEKCTVRLGVLPRSSVLVFSGFDFTLAWKPDELRLSLLAHPSAVGNPYAWAREEAAALNDSLEREPGLWALPSRSPAFLSAHDIEMVRTPEEWFILSLISERWRD